jgi:hypothetical protein
MEDRLSVSSDSDPHEDLAHRVWHLHVCLLLVPQVPPFASEISRTQVIF